MARANAAGIGPYPPNVPGLLSALTKVVAATVT